MVDQSVPENEALEFTVSASDLDNDDLMYSMEGLPVGATLDTLTGSFAWTPTTTRPASIR